jgi:hypothetical protein
VNAGPDGVLDEETTVRDSADARAIIPVLVRSPERWLDLALVIDTGQSMILWDKLIAEFRRMLAQLGAFRAVRTWHLRFDGKATAVSSGTGIGSSDRPLGELVDPSGRQAILVISDCVGEPWRTGQAMEALDGWARTGPLAIVQPLSQRLWSRSAVACSNVQLHARYPAAPNHQVWVYSRDHSVRHGSRQRDPDETEVARDDWAVDRDTIDGSSAGVVVPILEMTPRWLASWARLVSGTSPVYAVATFTAAPRQAVTGGADLSADLDPVQVVNRFAAAASPEAVRLAGLLAAAPLNLSLMRHIQHEMMPGSRPLQLAEVYLGGLLRTVPAYGPRLERRPSRDMFDFVPGVRDVLLGTIRRSEAQRVMQLVSGSRRHSTAEASSLAYAEVPLGTRGSTPLTTEDEFYGTITAEVARRMGIDDLAAPPTTGEISTRDGILSTDLVQADTGTFAEIPAPKADQPVPLQRARTVWQATRSIDTQVTARPLEHGITLLGTPSSGKTTLLAALGPALTQRGGEWKLVPADDGSAQTLISMITHLTAQQVFPEATSREIVSHHWQLWGQNPRARWQWFRRPEQIRLDLHVADPDGEIFAGQDVNTQRLEENLIETLVNCRGITFLFDPIREFEHGDAFEYVLHVVTRLAQRVIGPDVSADGRLPHYVSVCVSKFDAVPVFETARMRGLLTVQPNDPYGFPRVADGDARGFFSMLCSVSKTDTARLAMNILERFFYPERIRYFITSAIGFYVDRRIGVFNVDDYINTIGDGPGKLKIRGAIHPINVAEPLIWLGGRLTTDVLRRPES